MDNLEYVSPLGNGYFCNVKKYKDKVSKDKVAIKELKQEYIDNDDYKHRFKREIRITNELKKCDNIIDVLDSYTNYKKNDKIWYSMPCADYNLLKYIKKYNNQLTDEERINILDQVILAIEYAHSKDILHRDLSPNNILLFNDRDGKVVVKVSDFGLGKDYKSLSHLTVTADHGYGQFLYTAPEQRACLKNSSIKSDIYSLGKVAYFIMTGRSPENITQCKLSVVIEKAIKEDKEERFNNITEFKSSYEIVKNLIIGESNSSIDINSITIKEYIEKQNLVNWEEFDIVAKNAVVKEHLFYSYLYPITDYLLKDKNLIEYAKYCGDSIIYFFEAYTNKVKECTYMTGWPFRYTEDFGYLIREGYRVIDNDSVKLMCLKALWDIGVEGNEFKVESMIRDIIESGNIPESIVISFSAYISNSKKRIEFNSFYTNTIQKPIKQALNI
ncbi:serine/threonine protein kinase [[Clostridium] sordellii]|uniref:serine/threonine-protein kinase n=1 Tax=Paraclostridium sordellii TaxID=1505 RepID=UPI0005E9B4C9|nr:serine/threonine-protein kinase [Paeniclostridium sordellii]CEP95523.1 serine/threonine protein kinase [[Clostridium] sordellii] [Paeniclostridium sordellii]